MIIIFSYWIKEAICITHSLEILYKIVKSYCNIIVIMIILKCKVEVKMKSYRCENCGAQLKIDAIANKGFCQACGNEYFLVALDVLPLKKRLLKLANERNRKNISRATDLKAIASEILSKEPEDTFANFYFALAEKLYGNISLFQKFVQTADYDATQDQFNLQMLRDVIVEGNKRLEYDIQQHIKRVLKDKQLIKEYTEFLADIVEMESQKASDYLVSDKDVFVCHASEDNLCAENIVDELARIGIKSWISTRNIRPNSPDYWQDIESGIQHSKIMLVISGANSMNSNDCCREIEFAKKEELLKIEYKIDSLKHNQCFAEFFGNQQWIDSIGDYKKGMSYLLAEIKDMLEAAKINKKRHQTRLEQEQKERQKQIAQSQEDIRKMREFAKDFFASATDAQMNNDWRTIANAVFNCLLNNDIKMARSCFGRTILPRAVSIIVQMAMTLTEFQLAAKEKKPDYKTRLNQQSSNLKTEFANIQDDEKALYVSINNSEILAYLANLFYLTAQQERLTFVLDYINVTDIYDVPLTKKFIAMLFKSQRFDMAMALINANFGIDGIYILKCVIDYVQDNDQKIKFLRFIADKYNIADSAEELLNNYLATTTDDKKTVLAVVYIMAKNNIKLDAQLFGNANFSQHLDIESLDIVFESLKGSTFSGSSIDKILEYAIQKNNAEVLNYVLGFLIDTCNIIDIGDDNIQKIYMSMDFSGADRILIYGKLCSLTLQRKLKDAMVKYYFDNSKDDSDTKIAIISTFSKEPTKVTISSFKDYLINSEDEGDVKLELAQKLFGMCTMFSQVEDFAANYMLQSKDDEITKHKILGIVAKNKGSFDSETARTYLKSPQSCYSEGYLNVAKNHLAKYPAFASEMLKIYIDNHAQDTDNKVLRTILKSLVSDIRTNDLEYFIQKYNMDGAIKAACVTELLQTKHNLKKLKMSFDICGYLIECNVAQAYALFALDEQDVTIGAIEQLVKNGCKMKEKLIDKKTKQKYELSTFAQLIKDNLTQAQYNLCVKQDWR